MRTLFWLILLATLAVGLTLLAGYNSGYALFVWPPWRVEISLVLLLALALAGFFLLHWLLLSIRAMTAMPQRVREWRKRRQLRKSASALTDALRYLFEGRYARALTTVEEAWRKEYEPGIAALLALRAAHALRDETRIRLWLMRAEFFDRDVRAARLMTQAELALEMRDFAAARDLLAQVDGQHIASLRLTLRAQQGLQNWPEVVRLARQLEKARALTHEQAKSVYQHARREIAAGFKDPVAFKNWWDTLGGSERQDAALVLLAARTLSHAGSHAEARGIMEDFLDQQWDSGVIACYAECPGGDILARIAHAERWLIVHPHDEQLLLALGRLCRAHSLWGKAQSYLEASLAIQPTLAAQLELAQFFVQMGKDAEANRMFREAALFSHAQQSEVLPP